MPRIEIGRTSVGRLGKSALSLGIRRLCRVSHFGDRLRALAFDELVIVAPRAATRCRDHRTTKINLDRIDGLP